MRLLLLAALLVAATPAHARWFPWSPFPGHGQGLTDCGKGWFLGFNRECWRRIY